VSFNRNLVPFCCRNLSRLINTLFTEPVFPVCSNPLKSYTKIAYMQNTINNAKSTPRMVTYKQVRLTIQIWSINIYFKTIILGLWVTLRVKQTHNTLLAFKSSYTHKSLAIGHSPVTMNANHARYSLTIRLIGCYSLVINIHISWRYKIMVSMYSYSFV